MASPIAIALPAGIPVQPKGQQLWFELTDASDRANFSVYGGPGDLTTIDLWTPSAAVTSGYAITTMIKPYLVVSVKGCF
jgi:hypothetical protein